MVLRHVIWRILSLLTLGTIVVGCGSVAPKVGLQPTQVPTTAPLPTRTPIPIPTRESIELVVLHTNDNWGETEPCG